MIINTVFNPLSYDQLAKPLIEMTNLQHQVDESYAQDDEKASTIQSLIKPELDKTTYSTYQKYLNDLSQARDDLNQNGLRGPSTMKRLLDTKHLYNKDIIPIATKAKFRQDQINLQREAQLKDPSIVFDVDYSKQSLDNIDLNSSNKFASVNSMVDQISKEFAVIANSKIDSGELKTVAGLAGNQLKMWKETTGWGPTAVFDALTGSNEQLRKIAKTVIQNEITKYGIDKWSGNNAENAKNQILLGLQGAAYALSGTGQFKTYTDEVAVNMANNKSQDVPTGDPGLNTGTILTLGTSKDAIQEYERNGYNNLKSDFYPTANGQSYGRMKKDSRFGKLFDKNGKFEEYRVNNSNIDKKIRNYANRNKISYTKAMRNLFYGSNILSEEEKNFIRSGSVLYDRVRFIDNLMGINPSIDINNLNLNTTENIIKKAGDSMTSSQFRAHALNYDDNIKATSQILDNSSSVQLIKGAYNGKIVTKQSSALKDLRNILNEATNDSNKYRVALYLNPNENGIIVNIIDSKTGTNINSYLIKSNMLKVDNIYKNLNNDIKVINGYNISDEEKNTEKNRITTAAMNDIGTTLLYKTSVKTNTPSAQATGDTQNI